jgi:hypothetical protein
MLTSPCWRALAIATALGALGALGLGCGGDKTATPAPAGSGSAPSATPPASVQIFVNTTSVATIPVAQLASWPRLDTLVPTAVRRLGTWENVTLQGAQSKPIEVPRPSTTYPDMVPALFPSGGGVAFGMFDPVELAKKGQPALRQDNVTAIRITIAQDGGRGQNDDGGATGGDPTKLVVTVTTPAGTTRLTGEKILALPREPMPGNADQRGWRLTALLEAAGIKSYQRLVLTDATGANLTLDRKDVNDASIPFVKLNRQGALRFRVFKKVGDGWNPGSDLRGLISIDAK